ncbi:MAG TPA: tetratricopeptide repeat protein [Anaerolineales bacterium]
MGSTNLPAQLTSFIGRERDLAEVEHLLSTARLVTLTGTGGSGKTRLAIQIGYEISGEYPDGVWLVDLAPLRDPALVAQLAGQALGLRLDPGQPVLESLLGYMRSKQLLLILDNCEHLSQASAQLARQLLSQSTGLRILATSREALSCVGERIYPLSGLPWPTFRGEMERNGKSRLDLQYFTGFDAVNLFLERARAISPNFSLTSDNSLAIVEICRRLDGLPLALELASAWANVLTVQEIAARLDDRFSLLTSSLRTGQEPRHQTLRAAIDWSYALLSAEEQTLLNRLAVFSAGCGLDTAEAVCSGDGIAAGRTLDLLSGLVAKSLVTAETTGRAQARYRLLETIREYALEKLRQAGEERRLRDRHLEQFSIRSEEAAPKLVDAYQKLWLNWLEGEHDNLRAALAWSLKSGQIEAGLRTATALTRFWEIRGYVQEGLVWFERLLAQPGEEVLLVVRVSAYANAGFLAMFLGKVSTAMRYGREAVALAEAAGDEGSPVLVLALGSLVGSAQAAGDFQTAYRIGQRALQLIRGSSAPPYLLGMTLLGFANVAIDAGHYDIARQLLDESLVMAQAAGDAFRTAHAFGYLGDLARCEGNYAEAQSAYEKCVKLLRELDARHNLASILRSLGRTCLLLGEVERAQALFGESLAIHQAEHNRSGIAECLVGFASIALGRRQPAAGARLLAAAAAIGGSQWVESVWPAKRLPYEEYLAQVRAALTEAEFQAEQAAGRAMTLEQAIDDALDSPAPSGAKPKGEGKPDDLTGREREVAARLYRALMSPPPQNSRSKRSVSRTACFSANSLMKMNHHDISDAAQRQRGV